MTDQHEFAGKTIEEALELAADELAADAESIEYKLLETPKRFFFMGGSKEYRIRVLKYTPATGGKPVNAPPSRPARPAERAERAERPEHPERKERREPAAEQPDRRPAPPRRPEPEKRPAPPRRPEPEKRPEPPRRPEPEKKRPATPPAPPKREEVQEPQEERIAQPTAESTGDEELDRILDLVDDFIDCWGMNLEMEVHTTDERLEISFYGEDEQCLLEKKGAGLLAVQLILGKMLYKRGLIRRKLQVDCKGYRLRRENELKEIAHRTADRVKQNKEDAFLNPMNPYERRIVHLALVDDGQVTTESLGDGYMKKIRVKRI